VSRYDLFRRRIAPIALILAFALMARESCQKAQRVHATFVFSLGAAAPRTRALDVEVWTGGEQHSTFHREGLVDGARFTASLPGEDGELRIDVDVAGTHHRLVRPFHAVDDSTVTVPLESALEPR
jgi:hypothetical protein